MVVGILTIIATILAGIWSGVKTISEKALTLALAGLDLLKKGFDWFITTSPRWLQLILFLFFMLVITDTILGFFLGLTNVCLSTGELRTPDGLVGGFGLYVESVFQDFENSSTDRDQWVLENTKPGTEYSGKDEKSILYVKCYEDEPKLTFFGINFLDYRYWVILLLIGLLFRFHKYIDL